MSMKIGSRYKLHARDGVSRSKGYQSPWSERYGERDNAAWRSELSTSVLDLAEEVFKLYDEKKTGFIDANALITLHHTLAVQRFVKDVGPPPSDDFQMQFKDTLREVFGVKRRRAAQERPGDVPGGEVEDVEQELDRVTFEDWLDSLADLVESWEEQIVIDQLYLLLCSLRRTKHLTSKVAKPEPSGPGGGKLYRNAIKRQIQLRGDDVPVGVDSDSDGDSSVSEYSQSGRGRSKSKKKSKKSRRGSKSKKKSKKKRKKKRKDSVSSDSDSPSDEEAPAGDGKLMSISERQSSFRVPRFLRKGTELLMHGKSGKPKQVYVLCTKDRLYWGSSKEKAKKERDKGAKSKKSAVMRDVQNVAAGKKRGVAFKKNKKAAKAVEGHCFSILLDGKTLDFEAPGTSVAQNWVLGIQDVVMLYR